MQQQPFCPISREVKKNQTMRFSQLIEYKERNIFFRNHAENEAGKLVPDLLLFFEKALYRIKENAKTLVLMYFVDS